MLFVVSNFFSFDTWPLLALREKIAKCQDGEGGGMLFFYGNSYQCSYFDTKSENTYCGN